MDQLVTSQDVYNAQGYETFSCLPDDIIYKILSLLGADDVAQFALLSRRCRQLFISRPCLKFKCTCLPDDPSCLCAKFIDDMDRILSRQNGLAIVSFHLQWVCFNGNCDLKPDFVDKWTNIAVSCRAQKLDLAVGLKHEEKLFKTPNCIFSSRFLRVLKLHLTCNILEEPTGVLASLEELSLCKLAVIDECLEKWISACPSLKRLSISEIVDAIYHVRIASESLEELDMFRLPCDIKTIDISTDRLQKLSLDLDLRPEYGGALKVKAPNLQYLRLMGKVNVIYLSEWKFLKKATLCLDTDNGYIEEETICSCLAELLRKVHHVTVLEINSDIFEMIHLHNLLSVQLNNLHHLAITVDGGFPDRLFPIFASDGLFSPKLKTMFFKCSGNKYRMHNEMELEMMASEFYRPNKRPYRIGDQPSALEIELKGNIDQIGPAVEWMVQITKGLKKITIFSSRENLEMLSKIWKDIWKTVSRHLEVNLVEKIFDK